MVIPRLGDLSPTKAKFVAGERVIARVDQTLSLIQKKRIISEINKYAGVELNALVVNCSEVSLIHLRPQGGSSYLAGPSCVARKSEGRILHFGCAKVEFSPLDRFMLSMRSGGVEERKEIYLEIRRWVGDHEIAIFPWKF